jgi:hypothetical protein
MYAATVSDASSYALLMVLIAWIFGVTAVAVVVLFVAWWAFAKAESRDVPQVLTGLAHLLRAASWPKDLLGRGSVTGSPPSQPAAPNAGRVAGDPPPVDGHDYDDNAAGGGR